MGLADKIRAFKIRSLFTLGVFSETRHKNGLSRKLKTRLRPPQKGDYLKPGLEYDEVFESTSPVTNACRNYRPVMNPKSGFTTIVYYNEEVEYERQETFWLVVDVVSDEFGNFKFHFIGPTSFGWSDWMELETFGARYAIVER